MREPSQLKIKRKRVTFAADRNRVITRLFIPGDAQKVRHLIHRLLDLPEREVDRLLDQILEDFSGRHRNINAVFLAHYREGKQYVDDPGNLSAKRRLLIGAYLTREYSIESAALFNPSMVADPDQNDLGPGCLRVIISFRATGEGHVSSIEFRRAVLNEKNDLVLEPVSPYLEAEKIVKNMFYDRNLFGLRLLEMILPKDDPSHDRPSTMRANDVLLSLLDKLDDQFNYAQLREALSRIKQERELDPEILPEMLDRIDGLAKSDYQIRFSRETPLSERVIFPVSNHERRGIEDARFVRFVDGEDVTYYATYAAFDGANAQTQLLETKGFLTFNISSLSGKHANTKGLSLFPRKINGKYAMISRIDGENLYVMYSSDVHFWHDAKKLQEPKYPWEFVQIGNCGSPIETDAGWLLLTHGVGPMRRYCLGATLLDLEDPTKVIGRLDKPLLAPDEYEREGYVPNVVYTCGGIVHNNEVIIPYAMSDSASSVATVSLPALLDLLRRGNG